MFSEAVTGRIGLDDGFAMAWAEIYVIGGRAFVRDLKDICPFIQSHVRASDARLAREVP